MGNLHSIWVKSSIRNGGGVVRTAKFFPEARAVYYQPEIRECLFCGTRLRYAHAVWRKHLITLSNVVYAVNLGYKCPNPACPRPEMVYRSAVAESLCLKHLSYGMDVLAEVGFLRFRDHCTRAEIHQALRRRNILISERQVQYLYEVYLDPAEKVGALTTQWSKMERDFPSGRRNCELPDHTIASGGSPLLQGFAASWPIPSGGLNPCCV